MTLHPVHACAQYGIFEITSLVWWRCECPVLGRCRFRKKRTELASKSLSLRPWTLLQLVKLSDIRRKTYQTTSKISWHRVGATISKLNV